ncbi:hypothetical protein [Nonomuraea sediminis]|uniref:hypothetical protein n=1 Tax=Nonomuraea sediminis TaxID=2835864 RepID=UPI001BDC457F|nr:hypothetical protein [Nonomuraea sediminis]
MDIRTASRVAGAVSLIVGSLAIAIPIEITDENAPIAAQLQDYAHHSALGMLSNLVLLPVILMVPAVIYAARLARRGAPRLAFVGGGLSALGWIAGAMSIGAGQIALYQGSQLADQAGAAALIERINGDPVYGTLVGVFVLGHAIGMIVLGVGLWRSRAVAPWVAALFVAYPVGHVVGHAISPVLDSIAGVFLLVSAVAVAAAVLRTPNELWDLPAGKVAAEPVAAQTP